MPVSAPCQQLFQQPLRHSVFHRHCLFRLLRQGNPAVIPQKAAQHGIYKTRCTRLSAGTCQLHRRIHRSTCRNLVAVQQLVNPQPQNIPHRSVQLAEGLFAIVRQHCIQSDAPFNDTVIEGGAQALIPLFQRGLRQRMIQQQIGIALLLFRAV